jgi:hypothetical protein
VLGAALGSTFVMVVFPVVVVTIVVTIVALLAAMRANRQFFLSFAKSAGLEYVGGWEILPFTPLLGAGNRQRCTNWMIGDIVKEPPLTGGFGHFVYEQVEEAGTDGTRKRKFEENHLTVCVVDMEESIHLFKGVFLRQRRGLLNFKRDWLADTPSHAVEMESSEFTHKYELRIAEGQDELVLRQLLSPTLVNWLAGHPLSPGFEVRGGTLVVFVPKLLTDAGNLTFLLDAARQIARRVRKEVDEEAQSTEAAPKTAGL